MRPTSSSTGTSPPCTAQITTSRALPSRQAREIVIWAVQGGDVPVLELVGIIAWTLALGVLAVVLYRRDEGRRFR